MLTRDDLMSLEQYAEQRSAFRDKVIEHKKHRQIRIGDHATLYFEDQLTIQYQIQEMLRIEKIFEADGIVEELEAYNPLIPDGRNLKATFMLEFPDVEERKVRLAELIGVEKQVWIQVGDTEAVYPIANEDLDRETDEKTSAVHFLRFELSEEAVSAAKTGAEIQMGINHPHYAGQILLSQASQDSLVGDLA